GEGVEARHDLRSARHGLALSEPDERPEIDDHHRFEPSHRAREQGEADDARTNAHVLRRLRLAAGLALETRATRDGAGEADACVLISTNARRAAAASSIASMSRSAGSRFTSMRAEG